MLLYSNTRCVFRNAPCLKRRGGSEIELVGLRAAAAAAAAETAVAEAAAPCDISKGMSYIFDMRTLHATLREKHTYTYTRTETQFATHNIWSELPQKKRIRTKLFLAMAKRPSNSYSRALFRPSIIGLCQWLFPRNILLAKAYFSSIYRHANTVLNSIK